MSDVAAPEIVRVEGPLASLRAGEIVVVLRDDEVDRRAATLEAVLDRVRDQDTKLVWAGNPLRSPLTIERILLQVVGADVDLRVDYEPAALAQLLSRAAGNSGRMLIVLQQPETLDPVARETLAQLGETLRWVEPPVQFLICGGHAWQLSPPDRSGSGLASTSPSGGRRALPRWLVQAGPLAVLLVLAVLGAAMLPSPAGTPALPSAPEQATVAPTAPDRVALRREFELFLADRSARMPPLSDEQKSALFEEFLARRRQMTGEM